MKKVLLVLALIALFTIPALAQFDAGFLDGPGSVTNPAAWTSAGWYCLDVHPWPAQNTIVAGPFSTQPNCNGY